MTELEILAGLKVAYIRIEDIIEKCCTQLSVQELFIALNILDEEYVEVYEKIQAENEELLYYGKDIMIAENICSDYVTRSEDYDDQYITYADLVNEKNGGKIINFY